MLVISNSATLARALDSPIDPGLRALLGLRRDQLTIDGFDIDDIARYVVAQSGDAFASIEAEMGLPIATNIVDGSRYPDPGYSPNWEWCLHHSGICWEAPFILSDDGAAIVLIVMDQEGVNSTLLDLCRTFGTSANDLPLT